MVHCSDIHAQMTKISGIDGIARGLEPEGLKGQFIESNFVYLYQPFPEGFKTFQSDRLTG